MTEDFSLDRMNNLLEKTRAGEPDAFAAIAEQYKPLIEGCICYFYGSVEADELEQEALIALYRAACNYDPNVSNVSFGLYAKICINNSLISLVRSYKKQEEKANTELDDQILETGADPSLDFINKESFLMLDSFIRNHLSEYEYAVFRLYIEGYKIREITQRLKKSKKSVEGAIMRMRVKLRRCLSQEDL